MVDIPNGRLMTAVINHVEVDIANDIDTAPNQYHFLVVRIVLVHQWRELLVIQALVHVRYLYSMLNISTSGHRSVVFNAHQPNTNTVKSRI